MQTRGIMVGNYKLEQNAFVFSMKLPKIFQVTWAFLPLTYKHVPKMCNLMVQNKSIQPLRC
jgi:hypothetical protein